MNQAIRVYQQGIYAVGDEVQLTDAAAHHLQHVLRLRAQHNVTLFNGDNHEYRATILTMSKKQMVVRIEDKHYVNHESSRRIYLAQGVSKGERMPLVIQKAVELGVAGIIPLKTERTVVKLDSTREDKKQTHWQSIAIAACEQSGRNWVPTIQPICHFETFVKMCQSPFRVMLDPDAQCTWRDYSIPEGDMALLVGPEGGFSPSEITLAQQMGFNSLRFGPRILRTETAALVALSVLQALGGDI